MNTRSLRYTRYTLRLFAIALVAFGIPATWCHASVEPELTMAIGRKDVAHVKQLLASGVNVNERDEGAEQTPLMRAVQVQDAGLVQLLLAHGATVNAQDDFGKTALMFATERDDPALIKLLLRGGADTSLRDTKAHTALDIARAHGRTATIALLAHVPQNTLRNARRSSAPAGQRVVVAR